MHAYEFMNSFECMRACVSCDKFLKSHRLQTYSINDIYAWTIAVVRHEAHAMNSQLYPIQMWWLFAFFFLFICLNFICFGKMSQLWCAILKSVISFLSSFYQLEIKSRLVVVLSFNYALRNLSGTSKPLYSRTHTHACTHEQSNTYTHTYLYNRMCECTQHSITVFGVRVAKHLLDFYIPIVRSCFRTLRIWCKSIAITCRVAKNGRHEWIDPNN